MILPRFLKLISFILVSLFLILPTSAFAASVNLRWNANTEPDIASYNVHYGTASRTYGNPIPVGNVTSYTIDDLVEGQTYYFAVTALDTSGNESGYSPEESATASSSEPPGVILQPTAVSLSASMNSPQVEGTAVQFTASASGGSGNYEYKFWERGPATADQWRVVRNYSTSDTYTWDTTNRIGTTDIGVEARNAGTTIDSYSPDRTDIISFTTTSGPSQQPTQPTATALNSNVSSPQASGTRVVFTASASGGSGNYEYKYFEHGPATNYQWRVVRNYSTSNTYTWDSTNKIGTNHIAVLARNAGSTIDDDNAEGRIADVRFGILSAQGPSLQPTATALNSNISSPQASGTRVVFTASASGGSGNYEYKYFEHGPATNYQWRVVRNYSTSNTYTWDSTNKIGTNHIAVLARNAGSTIDDDNAEGRIADVRFGILSAQGPSLQPTATALNSNVSSPQASGTRVVFTASASGGSGNYEYKYFEHGPATNYQWRVVRRYSTSNTYTWDSTDKIGRTHIAVLARHAGSTIDDDNAEGRVADVRLVIQ